MKTPILQSTNGNVLICALCTIIIVSLVGANVLVNCARHYNITGKQLKAWKEAMYAAEAGGDAGFDEIRNRLVPGSSNYNTNAWSGDSWSGSGPWTKTFPPFGVANSLSTTVTIDKLTDNTGTIPSSTPFYRIRAVGTAKLFGLPHRVGLSDQFFAGGPNFVANSSTRGVGDTLLRKIDINFDHFKSTYGDGDGNNVGVGAALLGPPQVSRRIELVAVPKYYVFGGAMRLTTGFFGPGSAGIIDSYSSTHPNDPTPPTTGGGGSIPANTSSYWGPNPANTTYLADAHDGDVSVGSPTFTEGGPIWGDVTTNGGNVTHSPPYQISGTIDNNVPFTVPPLQVDSGFSGVAATSPSTTPTITAGSSATTIVVYSSDINNGTTVTIKNGQTDTGNILAYPVKYPTVKILVNGNIKGSIKLEAGVTAQIWFTGNIDVKANDLNNLNVDEGKTPSLPTDDPNPSRAGHLQFYGVSPAAGTTQKIDIAPPGNVFATFYAPSADMTVTGNPDIFSSIVARSFSGNGGGGGNTGFHYDKWLNNLNLGIVTDYQIASYVEDVR